MPSPLLHCDRGRSGAKRVHEVDRQRMLFRRATTFCAKRSLRRGNMDTINALLSLAELRMQTRDVREWQQVPLFLQPLRDLRAEEAQLLSQRLLAQYALQDEEGDMLRLLAQINMFVPGALAPLLPMLVAHQQFYPGHLYLGAGEETCQQ